MKLLITGASGFIGSNFVRYLLDKYPDYSVINLDKLTYAGNLSNLSDIEQKHSHRHQFIKGDICDQRLIQELSPQIEVIINFAAETHVDRSIHENSRTFIETDIIGTQVLLDAVRHNKNIRRFIQISTDEVYGDIPIGTSADENCPLRPSNPYSASKAGGDLQVLAYIRTYQVPAIISRCSNNYGPYMHPEKIIPLFITNLLDNQPVPIYGAGTQIRDWIHVLDHCQAIDLVLHHGKIHEIYNIGAENKPEITNVALTESIIKILGKSESLIQRVADRPGHDERYSINSKKIRALGWQPQYTFQKGLQETIEWYKSHRTWWETIKKSQKFQAYYQKQYKSW